MGAQTLRLATYHTDLTRRGPGLLLRDILAGKDAQIGAVVAVIAQAKPDVLLLTGFDGDHDMLALRAFSGLLAHAGHDMPHLFAPPQNAGAMTALDLNADGQFGGPEDAQGYGKFAGARSMALVSRLPLRDAADYAGFLWADLPGSLMPGQDPALRALQRLSSTAHWRVGVQTPWETPLDLLMWSATAPLFDKTPRNRLRNHDETAFWLAMLDGKLTIPPPEGAFVVMGLANTDPDQGAGDKAALRALLAHPMVQPGPAGPTAQFRDTALRLSYVLPSAGLRVAGSGVIWPDPDTPMAQMVAQASRHRLVWVDLMPP